MTTENTQDDFDKAFGDAALAAEKEMQAGGADTQPAATGEDTQPAASGADTQPAAAGADTQPAATGEDTQPAAPKDDKVVPETPAATPPAAAPAQPAPAQPPAATPPTPAAAAAAQPAPAAPAAPAETPEQKKQREEFEAMLAPYEFSEEEKKALEAMKKDFPSEYTVLEAHLKQVDRTINKRVFTAVQGVLQQVYGDLSPIAASASEVSAERHFAAVRGAHADYDAVVEKIPEWIKTQPAYLRPAMQKVYDEGTTQEVIELLTSYKAATGATTPPAASTPPAAPAVPKDAADLTPVKEKRSSPVPKGAPDMNDFDGAFAEAATQR